MRRKFFNHKRVYLKVYPQAWIAQKKLFPLESYADKKNHASGPYTLRDLEEIHPETDLNKNQFLSSRSQLQQLECHKGVRVFAIKFRERLFGHMLAGVTGVKSIRRTSGFYQFGASQ